MTLRKGLLALIAASVLTEAPAFADDIEIAIQSRYPPLQFPDASPGGA